MHMTFGGLLLVVFLILGGFGFVWYKYKQHENSRKCSKGGKTNGESADIQSTPEYD